MKLKYFVFLLSAAAAIQAPLFATVQVTSLTSDVASPEWVGRRVVFTATATDSNPNGVMFQLNVTAPNGGVSMVYDFNVGTHSGGVWSYQFAWASIAEEGTYQVQVVAKDFKSGESQAKSVSYVLIARSQGGKAAVNTTLNPLVALFSAPACHVGSTMQATFQQVGSTAVNATDWKACTGNTTMNFYVAGMYPSTTYSMNYQTLTGSTLAPGPTALSFTTGVLPSSITFPTFTSIPHQPTDVSQPLILSSLGYSSTLQHFPVATDLAGQITWYYDPASVTLLTRSLPGETMLSIQTGPAWTSFTQVQQLIREFDLAGNIVHQSNTGVIQRQLLALGAVDAGSCDAVPNPAPVGSACLSFWNHELMRMPNGYTVALATIEKVFPAGTQGSAGSLPVDIQGDIIVVLDTNWQAVWYWDSFNPAGGGNGYPKLPVSRPSILGETCQNLANLCGPVFLTNRGTEVNANQWLHGNSVYYEPSSGDFLFSMRSQDWVIKIDYNNGLGTGDVLWRLGNGGDFTFNNVNNDPWPWFSGQHDATYPIGGGPLTIFDDGNTRRAAAPLGLGAPPACNPYCNSRGMALTVDETKMQVTPVLSQYLGQNARAYGSAQLLDNGNYFFDAGIVSGNYGYGLETQLNPGKINGSVIFSMQGQPLYRSYRMTNLYQALPQ